MYSDLASALRYFFLPSSSSAPDSSGVSISLSSSLASLTAPHLYSSKLSCLSDCSSDTDSGSLEVSVSSRS